jgi:hypothetical protein
MLIRLDRTVLRRITRILLALAALVVAGFVLLVLIGLWSRYEQKTTGLDFRGIYEWFFATQDGLSKNPQARTRVEAEHSQQAQLLQQVPRLVGTGGVGNANQGMSVAVSADGYTVILGGPGPNNADRDRSPLAGPVGAAWVFTRRGSAWMQQGKKLVGTTNEYGGGLWSQGASVALSGDGKTAIVGGPSDDRTTGAAWIFTFRGEAWTQQGKKLVGSGSYKTGEPPLSPGQGLSVALSADGNTAIVGGWRTEGAWIFTRNGDEWTQQGNKLVGSGAVGAARQGMAVALSADGNTAIVGGAADNNNTGAAWVFTRIGGVWTQQGKKLVGSGAEGRARQGTSVAFSADGNTAILGAPNDSSTDKSRPFGLGPAGAAWVFTRTGGVWMQQGDKLVSRGAAGSARQGTSVTLSADGETAVLGGLADDGSIGAVSVFTRNAGHWMQDKELVGIGSLVKSASSVALSADGSLVAIGAPNDNGGMGAAWVFTRKGSGADEHAGHIRCREASDDVLSCNTSVSHAAR